MGYSRHRLKKNIRTSSTGGAGSPHDFGMGYKPTPQDISQRKSLDGLQHGLEKPQTGSNQLADPHQQAIQRAQSLPKQQPVKKEEKPQEESVTDKIANALYLPAFNEGVNDLLIKPFLGAGDFVGRTTDKLYRGITGEAKTPEWLYSNKGDVITNLSKDLDNAYKGRDKPKNIVSETAEGAVGSVPLVASLFTGEGEVSLASKAPNFISKATKLLATTTALNSYHEATQQGKGYTASLKEAAKGGVEGAEQGLTLDAQMLLGGALGKGVVNKVVEKGLLKGGKSGEALIHALSTATVFGGTPIVKDLLAGQDIDTHEAVKNFGMGLMFEAMPVAKGLHDEVSDRIGENKQNTQAAQQAVMATAASHLHGESVLQTLVGHDIDQLHAINTNVPDGHEDLYAQSIEQGMKAYESKNPAEKRDLLANQLLLKTQGDVKFIASHDNKALLNEIAGSDELDPAGKANLIDKINALSQHNEQTEPTTEVPVEAPKADASVGKDEPDKTVDEKGGDKNYSKLNKDATDASDKEEKLASQIEQHYKSKGVNQDNIDKLLVYGNGIKQFKDIMPEADAAHDKSITDLHEQHQKAVQDRVDAEDKITQKLSNDISDSFKEVGIKGEPLKAVQKHFNEFLKFNTFEDLGKKIKGGLKDLKNSLAFDLFKAIEPEKSRGVDTYDDIPNSFKDAIGKKVDDAIDVFKSKLSNDETTENNQINNQQNNGSKNEESGQKDGQKSGGEESSPDGKKGNEKNDAEKNDVKVTGGDEPPVNEKPRFKIKGDEITPLPPKERSEADNLLKEHGLTIDDYEQSQRNEGGQTDAPAGTDAENAQPTQNDGAGNAGKDRPGEGSEGSKSPKSKATFKKPATEIDFSKYDDLIKKSDSKDLNRLRGNLNAINIEAYLRNLEKNGEIEIKCP